MKKSRSYINRVLSMIAAATLVIMMFHVVGSALMRFFMNSPVYGTNEIVEYWYLPLIALFGIPAAQIKGEQITVTLAIDRMKKANADFFQVFSLALGAALSVAFAWFGMLEALGKASISATAGVTSIPAWPAYFIVPVVFMLLAYLYIEEIFSEDRNGSVTTELSEVSVI